jgi:DNA-binding CsgD family transcriptional regulator
VGTQAAFGAVLDALCGAAEAITLEEMARLTLPSLDAVFQTSHISCYRSLESGFEGWLPPGEEDPFPEYAPYFASDPLQEVKRRHNFLVGISTDLVEPKALRLSAVYDEFYRRRDLDRFLTVRLSDVPYGRPGVVGMILARSRRQAPWSRRDVQAMESLVRPLQAVVRRNERWEAAQRDRRALAAVLGEVAPASIGFDAQARVLWISPAAEQLLGKVPGGARALPQPLLDSVRGLAALASASRVPAELPLCLTIPCGNARGIRVFLRFSRTGEGDRVTIARLEAPAADAVALRQLATKYRLTPAETIVLDNLLHGIHRSSDIAARLGVASGTVRTHIRHLFDKLEVHSRVELVLKVRGFADECA